MKALILVISSLVIIGCTTTETTLFTMGPNEAVRVMEGDGSITRGADGKDAFSFYAPAEYMSDEKNINVSVGNWLGKNDYCKKGFLISKIDRTMSKSYVLVMGKCK
ncbi:MAG: hypothetical protein H6922_03645 [Pseudomonadaceae bacterium]|nr:hypothetical protein [Pseudomonadaceae bacterium]